MLLSVAIREKTRVFPRLPSKGGSPPPPRSMRRSATPRRIKRRQENAITKDMTSHEVKEQDHIMSNALPARRAWASVATSSAMAVSRFAAVGIF